MFCITNAYEVAPSACIDATSTSCPTAHLPHSIRRPSRFKATHCCAGHQTAIMAANRGPTVFRLTCLPHRRSSRSYQLATNRDGTRAQRNSLCQWRDLGNAAHKLLARADGWFTEGFDTLDLKEAKALLEQLATCAG
jgi:hypothetical protein